MLLIVMLLTATTAWADQQYLYLEVSGSSATMKYGEDYYGNPYNYGGPEWRIDLESWNGRGNIVTITVDASCQNFNGDNLSGLFSSFTALQTINNTANLNTSQVNDMSYMFENCSSFTKLDLSAWNTGKVTDMSYMFNDCGNLTKLNLSGWNTANVTNMISMFENCSSLAFIYVGTNWNTENVTNGDDMFVSCGKLPNFDGYYVHVSKAYVGDGGYLTSTYTVEFNANGGSGDAMESMQLTYDGDWATLPACTYIAPDGKAFKNWNTAADGSGAQYEDKEWVRNLTDEPNGTVVLYAQWGKDIAACTINVPGQTLDDYTAVSYKFEAANSGYASTGTTVYDGETLLTLGTDYRFGNVTMANGDPINWMGSKIGDECKVEIIGIGDYAGTIFKNFTVVSPETNGEWGDLAWAIDADGNFTISKKDGVEGNVAMNETTKGDYPWYDKAGYIKTITIGEGITTVAANAFCRAMEMNVYGNVHSLTLPESLTSIGEFAFAYCTALNINLTDLEGIDFPANAFSYINSLTGTLYDNADNTKTISVMAQVSKNDVTLTGRTLYKDGDWNTLCLPFDVSQGNSILDGATVKELDVENYYDANGEFYTKLDHENAFRTGFDAETGTLRLYFKNVEADGSGVVLQAGTPYLIKWDKADGYDEADPTTRDITGDHVFCDAKLLALPNNVTSKDHNVTFCGNYSPVTLAAGDKSSLYLGAENKLYWPSVERPINAFRAYFQLDGITADVRAFVMNLDDDNEATGISLTRQEGEKTDAWYTLDGLRMASKPAKKGMYIYKGKRIVIK